MRKFAKVILLTIIIFFGIGLKNIYSSNDNKNQIVEQKVNPGTILYGFKRLKEKTVLFVLKAFPSKRNDYYQQLTWIRFSELKRVVDNNDIANFEVVNQRYFSTVGSYAALISSDDKYFKYKKNAIELINVQQEFIKIYIEKFKYDSAQWLFLKQTEEYLDLFKNKISV